MQTATPKADFSSESPSNESIRTVSSRSSTTNSFEGENEAYQSKQSDSSSWYDKLVENNDKPSIIPIIQDNQTKESNSRKPMMHASIAYSEIKPSVAQAPTPARRTKSALLPPLGHSQQKRVHASQRMRHFGKSLSPSVVSRTFRYPEKSSNKPKYSTYNLIETHQVQHSILPGHQPSETELDTCSTPISSSVKSLNGSTTTTTIVTTTPSTRTTHCPQDSSQHGPISSNHSTLPQQTTRIASQNKVTTSKHNALQGGLKTWTDKRKIPSSTYYSTQNSIPSSTYSGIQTETPSSTHSAVQNRQVSLQNGKLSSDHIGRPLSSDHAGRPLSANYALNNRLLSSSRKMLVNGSLSLNPNPAHQNNHTMHAYSGTTSTNASFPSGAQSNESHNVFNANLASSNSTSPPTLPGPVDIQRNSSDDKQEDPWINVQVHYAGKARSDALDRNAPWPSVRDLRTFVMILWQGTLPPHFELLHTNEAGVTNHIKTKHDAHIVWYHALYQGFLNLDIAVPPEHIESIHDDDSGANKVVLSTSLQQPSVGTNNSDMNTTQAQHSDTLATAFGHPKTSGSGQSDSSSVQRTSKDRQLMRRLEYQVGNRIGGDEFGPVNECLNIQTGEVFLMKEILRAPLGMKRISRSSKASKFSGRSSTLKRKNVPSREAIEQRIKQLEQEVYLLKQAQSPYIIRHFGTMRGSEVLRVFTEKVSFGSIRDVLDHFGGALTEDVIRKYVTQILRGLAHLHERKIVHGALTTNHILVDSDGSIRLTGFASARRLQKRLGSRSDEKAAYQTDFRALGRMVVEMIRGDLVFTRDTDSSLFSGSEEARSTPKFLGPPLDAIQPQVLPVIREKEVLFSHKESSQEERSSISPIPDSKCITSAIDSDSSSATVAGQHVPTPLVVDTQAPGARLHAQPTAVTSVSHKSSFGEDGTVPHSTKSTDHVPSAPTSTKSTDQTSSAPTSTKSADQRSSSLHVTRQNDVPVVNTFVSTGSSTSHKTNTDAQMMDGISPASSSLSDSQISKLTSTTSSNSQMNTSTTELNSIITLIPRSASDQLRSFVTQCFKGYLVSAPRLLFHPFIAAGDYYETTAGTSLWQTPTAARAKQTMNSFRQNPVRVGRIPLFVKGQWTRCSVGAPSICSYRIATEKRSAAEKRTLRECSMFPSNSEHPPTEEMLLAGHVWEDFFAALSISPKTIEDFVTLEQDQAALAELVQQQRKYQHTELETHNNGPCDIAPIQPTATSPLLAVRSSSKTSRPSVPDSCSKESTPIVHPLAPSPIPGAITPTSKDVIGHPQKLGPAQYRASNRDLPRHKRLSRWISRMWYKTRRGMCRPDGDYFQQQSVYATRLNRQDIPSSQSIAKRKKAQRRNPDNLTQAKPGQSPQDRKQEATELGFLLGSLSTVQEEVGPAIQLGTVRLPVDSFVGSLVDTQSTQTDDASSVSAPGLHQTEYVGIGPSPVSSFDGAESEPVHQSGSQPNVTAIRSTQRSCHNSLGDSDSDSDSEAPIMWLRRELAECERARERAEEQSQYVGAMAAIRQWSIVEDNGRTAARENKRHTGHHLIAENAQDGTAIPIKHGLNLRAPYNTNSAIGTSDSLTSPVVIHSARANASAIIPGSFSNLTGQAEITETTGTSPSIGTAERGWTGISRISPADRIQQSEQPNTLARPPLSGGSGLRNNSYTGDASTAARDQLSRQHSLLGYTLEMPADILNTSTCDAYEDDNYNAPTGGQVMRRLHSMEDSRAHQTRLAKFYKRPKAAYSGYDNDVASTPGSTDGMETSNVHPDDLRYQDYSHRQNNRWGMYSRMSSGMYGSGVYGSEMYEGEQDAAAMSVGGEGGFNLFDPDCNTGNQTATHRIHHGLGTDVSNTYGQLPMQTNYVDKKQSENLVRAENQARFLDRLRTLES